VRGLLSVVLATAWLAPGQTADADRWAKIPREIRTLIDQSSAAQPELAADILLRLVEAGKIPDKEIRAEILERAFTQAGSARFPLRLIFSTTAGMWTDSDVGVRMAALYKHLDTLSLECRVIRAMLDTDRKRALEMFQSLPPLRIPTRSCSDNMVERVDDFYSTLALLVNRAFSDAEKRAGKHLELAESYLHSIAAPAQLEPAANMIVEFQLDGKRLAPMLTAYSAALEQMSADDRAFSSATHLGLLESLVRLAKYSEAKGVSSFALVDAFRAYYIRHMRGARCEDDTDPKGTGARLAQTADSFNAELLPVADAGQKQIKPIKIDELQPDKADGQAQVYEFWSKPQTEKLLNDLKHLRFGTPEQQAENGQKGVRQDGRMPFLSEQQRSALSWQIEAREYLNEVESWKKDNDETAEDYFHQVCFIYVPLLELVPPNEL
jgi:hypothetical protein